MASLVLVTAALSSCVVVSIEDLETSYYSEFTVGGDGGRGVQGGPPRTPGTTIELVKDLIDVLNRDFLADAQRNGRWLDFVVGRGNYSVLPEDGSVGAVHCYRNMCGVWKRRGGEFVEGQEYACWNKSPRPTLPSVPECAVSSR